MRVSPPRVAWSAGECRLGRRRIACRSADGNARAKFSTRAAAPDTFRFSVALKRLATTVPFASPLTATLTHAHVIDRRGTTSACEDTGTGLRCRD